MTDKRIAVKRALTIAFMFLLFIAFPRISSAEEDPSFKVIGYLPDYDWIYVDDTMDLAEFTDVNYFSLIPQADGKLKFTESGSEEQLKKLVEKSHRNNVRVGISIGGWDLSDNFASATSKENLDAFVQEIKQFTKDYKLDTIDIDWEYPAESEAKQFETFIKKLDKGLGEVNLSITVPSGVASNGEPSGRWEIHFTPEALLAADWVNIMSYDAQIPNYPNHSPLEMHEENLNYWNKVLGGDKMSHLVAGVPFYGKTQDGSVMTYRRIIMEAPEVPINDEVTIQGGLYYINNKETLKKKTEAAIELGSGGIMIWSPTMDTKITSSTNLMKVVFSTLKEKEVAIDQAQFATTGEVLATEKTALGIFKILSLILGLILLALGVALITGWGTFVLPDELKGKKVNKKFLGQVLGALGIVVSILLILLATLPVWVALVYLLALIGGIIFIIQKA